MSHVVAIGLRRANVSSPSGEVHHGRWHRAEHFFHHGEVFEVLVSLEERLSRDELDEDTPDRPHVAWKRPAER